MHLHRNTISHEYLFGKTAFIIHNCSITDFQFRFFPDPVEKRFWARIFYPFYHFQFTRKSPVIPFSALDLGTGMIIDTFLVFKPINYWDNAIGVGFEFRLSRKISFNLNAGVGVTFPFLYDNTFFGSDKINYVFIYIRHFPQKNLKLAFN